MATVLFMTTATPRGLKGLRGCRSPLGVDATHIIENIAANKAIGCAFRQEIHDFHVSIIESISWFDREARCIYASARIGANPQLYRRQFRRDQELEAQMKVDINTLPAKGPIREIEDSGKVRIGDMSPGFPPPRTTPAGARDNGKVRIGDMSPGFPPPRIPTVIVKDSGKVRIGDMSPSFPPRR
jgi:hypothetical protein